MNGHYIPLHLAAAGITLTVKGIIGGCGLQRRLADMGLTPGVEVTVISGRHPGTVLVDVRGSRIGLGFGVAQKIMVKEAADDCTTDSYRSGWQSQLR